jgi:DNA-directed RNA polymerase specialized sigma24 family protein
MHCIKTLNGEPGNEELAGRFGRDVPVHTDTLRRAAFRMMRRRADAEDPGQETVLRTYKAFGEYADGTDLEGLLFRTMSNTYIELSQEGSSQDAAMVADGILSHRGAACAPAPMPMNRIGICLPGRSDFGHPCCP